MPTINSIPSIVLGRVLCYLDPEDLKSARLVSRLFQHLATVILFRSISITARKSSLAALKQIALHPHLSRYVRKITYDATFISDQIRNWEFFNTWCKYRGERGTVETLSRRETIVSYVLACQSRVDQESTLQRSEDAQCLLFALKKMPYVRIIKLECKPARFPTWSTVSRAALTCPDYKGDDFARAIWGVLRAVAFSGYAVTSLKLGPEVSLPGYRISEEVNWILALRCAGQAFKNLKELSLNLISPWETRHVDINSSILLKNAISSAKGLEQLEIDSWLFEECFGASGLPRSSFTGPLLPRLKRLFIRCRLGSPCDWRYILMQYQSTLTGLTVYGFKDSNDMVHFAAWVERFLNLSYCKLEQNVDQKSSGAIEKELSLRLPFFSV
ncbi:MAG: ssDNA endonuclease and repair protein rad10 [Vezdaea acicularis]|nr:MAG: ssDNA endonuclease and repair protein rad10 [Vezdaea acicularis]